MSFTAISVLCVTSSCQSTRVPSLGSEKAPRANLRPCHLSDLFHILPPFLVYRNITGRDMKILWKTSINILLPFCYQQETSILRKIFSCVFHKGTLRWSCFISFSFNPEATRGRLSILVPTYGFLTLFGLCFFVICRGFPGGSDGKESTCNAGDLGSNPGSRRSLGGGHGNPLQYSWLENPMDRLTWWATVHGIAKSWS